MTKRPLLSANMRSVPTGPHEPGAMPIGAGATVIGLEARRANRPVFGSPAALEANGPETATAIVIDTLATASVLSCLAWTQSALLPLRLAAFAWQQSLPRAVDRD